MNVTFASEEVAVLITHMHLMKKSIRKGFKKTYQQSDWKEKYNDYLSVIDVFEKMIKTTESEKDFFVVNLSNEQFAMLHSFINFYVNEFNRKENSKDKLNHDVIKILSILEGVQMKMNILAAS